MVGWCGVRPGERQIDAAPDCMHDRVGILVCDTGMALDAQDAVLCQRRRQVVAADLRLQ